jgi:hypothetical protein
MPKKSLLKYGFGIDLDSIFEKDNNFDPTFYNQ